MSEKLYTYCLRCGRKLKTESARQIGFGRVCQKRIADRPKKLFEVKVNAKNNTSV